MRIVKTIIVIPFVIVCGILLGPLFLIKCALEDIWH